jgi:hypothetical protein
MLYSAQTEGSSTKCNNPRCHTCKYIDETNYVKDKNGTTVFLKQQLNCQSKGVVYLIHCSNCGVKYVGETIQKLKDRINQHRSDIKRNRDTVVATHFNTQCKDINFLKITPLEKVQRHVPSSYTVARMPDHSDEVHFLRREQFWIKKLNSLSPHGLNKRREMPPPIPFTIKFNDQAPSIVKILKETYEKIQARCKIIFRRKQMVIAFRKNSNLKNLLVRSTLNKTSD